MSEPLTVGGLCEGYGGIFLGLSQVLDVQHAWYCECEPPSKKHPVPANAAAKVAAHRFPGVPNLGDLTAVDWSQVEPVDLLTAGWPCQPLSVAGKQLGAEDERAIWPDIATAIGVLRPGYLFIENVPGVVVRGELARVLTDLARLGFDAEWACVRASDAGAPHRRERFFLAAANAENIRLHRSRRARSGRSGPAYSGDVAADTPSPRRRLSLPFDVSQDSEPATQHTRQAEPGRCDSAAPHPNVEGRKGAESAGRRDVSTRGVDTDWAGYASAIERWERALGRRAPAPTVLGKRGGRQLNARFVEWLMGLDDGWVTGVPGLTRNQTLKVLGNGVVPQQCAAAARHLLPLLLAEQVAA